MSVWRWIAEYKVPPAQDQGVSQTYLGLYRQIQQKRRYQKKGKNKYSTNPSGWCGTRT